MNSAVDFSYLMLSAKVCIVEFSYASFWVELMFWDIICRIQ